MKKLILLISLAALIGCQGPEQYGTGLESADKIKRGSAQKFDLLIMDSQTGEPYEVARMAMLNTLKSWGYVEGVNLRTTYFSIENDLKRGEEILKAEMKKDYDVIFTNGTVMTLAATNVGLDHPKHRFVFACVTDPVGMHAIDDFINPPKSNFTGVSWPVKVKSRFQFIKELIPGVKTIGLIYADMPQSHSYKGWVDDLLENDLDFKNIEVIFRKVPLITGKKGTQEMAALSKKHVLELDSRVDVFLSPNDQMGVQEYFPRMVYANATKPLIGLGRKDVMLGWGATMVIYPSPVSMGRQAARMIKELFTGRDIKKIIPEWPKEYGLAFDLDKTAEFGIKVSIEYLEMAGEDVIKRDEE